MTAKAKALFASLFFLFLAPGTVAGWIPRWITGWQMAPAFFGIEGLRWLGMVLILVGLAILGESFLRFALQGVGTPAPVYPTERLVIGGLYQYVRNPMYMAVVSVVVGQALYFANFPLLGYAVAVWLGFHLFVIGYEEPTLRKAFGRQYEDYCSAVPRWLPRFRR